MKLAIMQPYFLSYIGYFQLINSVDKFVLYDNIEFSKGGWINRNRIINNGTVDFITIPLKKGSDYETIREKKIAAIFSDTKMKILAKITANYQKAPHFQFAFELLKEIINYDTPCLFEFILNSLKIINEVLEIKSEIVISSAYDNAELKKEKRVIQLCKLFNADTYINSIGGINLYNKDDFLKNELTLKFLKTKPLYYKQLNGEFIPNLSILDTLMFNTIEETKEMLDKYELI